LRLSLELAKTEDLKLNMKRVADENIFKLFSPAKTAGNVSAIIQIDTIGLSEPLLIGVDAENLDIGIVELLGSQPMGHVGNYCLAGHNSKAEGRHFNRLGELDRADEIKIFDGAFTYKYVVFDSFPAEDGDIWPLQNLYNDSVLTMVTCDYSKPQAGRLVVQARLVDTFIGE
jgi:sortase A